MMQKDLRGGNTVEITLEQVEQVRQYANVTCEEAKAALEQAGGVPLDAVILLERQGKAAAVSGGGWSTRFGAPLPEESAPVGGARLPSVRQRPRRRRYTWKEVGDAVKNFLRNCTKISVDIWREDDLLVGIPLIICVLLFIVAYQIMIPLTILGLILRCRYHVSGWEGSTDGINRAMDHVTDAVADLTDRAKAEWGSYHNGKKTGK